VCRGLAGMVLTLFLFMSVALPAADGFKFAKSIACRIAEELPANTAVSTFGLQVPSLNFYLRRPVSRLPSAEEIRSFLAKPGPRICLARRRKLERIHPLPAGRILFTQRGYDFDHGRWVEIQGIVPTRAAK